MLDEHQEAFLNYDRKLPIVATLVDAKYPHSVTLDIGANVGDSAAAIRTVVAGPILCVEGNAAFLPYLRANLLRLSGTNRVIPKFIRPSEKDADSFAVSTARGTAHLLHNSAFVPNQGSPQTTTVSEVMGSNADVGEVKLIKIDTDGLDFAILLGALDILSRSLPVLYFEFDPTIGSSSADAAIGAVEGLIDIGYRKVVVYDNYGNYLIGTTLSAELAHDLVTSVTQCNEAGGGTKYYDLCCFSASDNDIFQSLVERERVTNSAP